MSPFLALHLQLGVVSCTLTCIYAQLPPLVMGMPSPKAHLAGLTCGLVATASTVPVLRWRYISLYLIPRLFRRSEASIYLRKSSLDVALVILVGLSYSLRLSQGKWRRFRILWAPTWPEIVLIRCMAMILSWSLTSLIPYNCSDSRGTYNTQLCFFFSSFL